MKHTKRWLAAAYLAALALWLLAGIFQLAKGAWYDSQGLRVRQTLGWEDLTAVSVQQVDTGQDGLWYVSTDSDPQLHWTGSAYLETVELDMYHATPGLSVVLYWREPGQTDFSSQNAVYAEKNGEGCYVFDLGGRRVEEIRIDPDSLGGVVTRFDGVVLNPERAWYTAFAPTAAGVLLFAVLPLVAVAALREVWAILEPAPFQKEK